MLAATRKHNAKVAICHVLRHAPFYSTIAERIPVVIDMIGFGQRMWLSGRLADWGQALIKDEGVLRSSNEAHHSVAPEIWTYPVT